MATNWKIMTIGQRQKEMNRIGRAHRASIRAAVRRMEARAAKQAQVAK